MSRPRITPEAWADLQRRAQLKGLRLTRSESNGETRVWVDGREALNLEDLEAIIVHARSAWDSPLAPAKAVQPPTLSPKQLEDQERLRQARMSLGAAALQGAIGGRSAAARDDELLAQMQALNAAEGAIEHAKRAP